MAWQENHVAWLKLYHHTLESFQNNYQGINGGVSYVKQDTAGDLIKKKKKKLIIFHFQNSEFSKEYGPFFSFSLLLSFVL